MLGVILAEASRRYRADLRTLLGIAALVALPATLIAGLLFTRGPAGQAATFLSQLLFGGLVIAACTLVVAVRIEGLEPARVGDALRGAQSHLGRVLLVSVLYLVATIAGGALGLIPGLLAATFWLLVIPLAVVERRGLDAFGRSVALVRGHGGVALAVALIVVVLLILALPLALALVLGAVGIGAAGQAALGTLVTFIVADPLVAALLTVTYFAFRGDDIGDREPAQPSA